MELELRLVHLQLTRRCNLRCSYCGQWGQSGAFNENEPPVDLDRGAWIRAIDSIDAYCSARDAKPAFCLWGGEPLLYGAVDKLLQHLRRRGFEVGLITNGTLLQKHSECIIECVDTLYISLDGPREAHEAARNAPGVFDKVVGNIARVRNADLRKVCLTTITEGNYRQLPDFPLLLADIGFDKVIFQNLIFATPGDVQLYKQWMADSFGINAAHVDAWESPSPGDYVHNLPASIKLLEERTATGQYPIEVELSPDGLVSDNVIDWYLAEGGLQLPACRHEFCLAPWRHLHIAATGDVHFCIDFDDFSAGNIRNEDVVEIILNQRAKRFREDVAAGKNPLCKHCPWRFNTQYALD